MAIKSINRRKEIDLRWPKIVMAVLSTIGLVNTGSITLDEFGLFDSSSFCIAKNGCAIVLGSPWGTLLQINGLDIPLSLAGLITYAFLLTLCLILTLKVISSKQKLNRFIWWLIFLISCASAAFSSILIIDVMILKIKVICTFCIISAILSFSIFILSIIGAKFENRGTMLYRGFIVAFSVIIGGLIWSNQANPSYSNELKQIDRIENIIPQPITTKSSKSKIEFAKFLTKNNVVMYSAWWCSHCNDQKNLFGKEAVKELTIIECAKDGENSQYKLCEEKGIKGTPSWEIDKEIYSGTQTLDDLADLTGYEGNTNF